MALVIHIPCDGHDHRLALDADGTLTTLDHDSDQVAAFTAFGAELPPCMKRFERYFVLEPWGIPELMREALHNLVEHSTRTTRTRLQRDFAALAYEYADRAADAVLWVEPEYDDDIDIPADLLAVTGRYIRGEARRSDVQEEMNRANDRVAELDREGYSGRTYASAVYRCAIVAAQTALMSLAGQALALLLDTAERSRELVVTIKEEIGIDDEDSEEDDSLGNEALWQLRRAVKTLEVYGG
jgi:hypothetical protein